MKSKLKILPLIVLLAFISIAEFMTLKKYSDEVLQRSGFHLDKSFHEKLKEENLRALESQEDYQKIIDLENGDNNQTHTEENEIKDLRLRAISALLLDGSNNRVLYEENGYNRMPMASTTKIMTCIVALEKGNLDDVVTISSYAATMPDVQLNIRSGEQYILGDLLYSLMLESHNDVAVAVAEHIGGSVEGFAVMMNDKARLLGCNDTNFVTPNGLDAEDHYTTARDMAVIASYTIKNENFIKITNSANHNFKEINNKRSFAVSNKNRFLYMMDGAIGVKTGFTGGAGYCFVGAVKKSDRTLVSVVLGCGWPPNKNLKWTDTKNLMNYGIDNYEVKQIFQEVTFEPIQVKNGQERYLTLKLNGDLTMLMRKDELVKVEYKIPVFVEAPIEDNSVIGHAHYLIDDKLYYVFPIYAEYSVEKINYEFCLKKIFNLWMKLIPE